MSTQVNLFPTENVGHTKVQGFTSASNIITDPIYLGLKDQYSVMAIWTGAGTGTFDLQGSNDEEINGSGSSLLNGGTPDPNIVNWVTIGGSSMASSLGSPIMWNYSNVGYRWLRVRYTVSSSSITLTLTVQLKAIG